MAAVPRGSIRISFHEIARGPHVGLKEASYRIVLRWVGIALSADRRRPWRSVGHYPAARGKATTGYGESLRPHASTAWAMAAMVFQFRVVTGTPKIRSRVPRQPMAFICRR